MSITLKENVICPHANTCPYNNQQNQNFCTGAQENRKGIFICDFATEDGQISDGKFRSKFDETGRMKVILENGK